LESSISVDVLDAWAKNASAHFEEIFFYLSYLLDNSQLQPIGKSASEPTGLYRFVQKTWRGISDMGTPIPLPHEGSSAILTKAKARIANGHAPLIVHKIRLDNSLVNLSYRQTKVPLSTEAIKRSINVLFGAGREVKVSARAAPETGDIAVIGEDVECARCTGYGVVLDYTGALHSDYR